MRTTLKLSFLGPNYGVFSVVKVSLRFFPLAMRSPNIVKHMSHIPYKTTIAAAKDFEP